MYHDFSWSRIKRLYFWKGQILCRLFGHRINDNPEYLWCGRCGLAFEEIYCGLNYFERMRSVFGVRATALFDDFCTMRFQGKHSVRMTKEAFRQFIEKKCLAAGLFSELFKAYKLFCAAIGNGELKL